MRLYLFLVAAASGALASLNCTATADINTYCCPDTNSELVKTVPSGGLLMLGCAADNTNKNYYWNYNGLYTPYSTNVMSCTLNGLAFDDMKVLPDCIDDTFVLDMTNNVGLSGPLDACNPNCMSENDLPANTYFGDTQLGINMASDFPTPAPVGGWGWWGLRQRRVR